VRRNTKELREFKEPKELRERRGKLLKKLDFISKSIIEM
jgi:hypothetical protein